MISKFISSETGTLVSRTGLVNPYMNINAFVISHVHRGQGRTVINGSQPAGIAVGEDVNPLTVFLPAHLFYQRQTVYTCPTATLYLVLP